MKLPCISLMGLSYVQGPVLVGQPVTPQEGSAAGQLRLMTAQHHAQQHQPPPGILQSPTRPVNTAHIPPDQLLTYQVRYLVNIKFNVTFTYAHPLVCFPRSFLCLIHIIQFGILSKSNLMFAINFQFISSSFIKRNLLLFLHLQQTIC